MPENGQQETFPVRLDQLSGWSKAMARPMAVAISGHSGHRAVTPASSQPAIQSAGLPLLLSANGTGYSPQDWL